MPDSPPTFVVDTNVLIDLHVGGLIHAFFALPYVFVAPDVIVAELQAPAGQELVEHGLREETLPGEQVAEVVSLVAQHCHVSTNDLFALVLARVKHTTLLTGDRHLRELARQEGVPIHGTLWVLDEMVEQGVIPSRRAAEALERMLECGTRLPQVECDRRLRRWR